MNHLTRTSQAAIYALSVFTGGACTAGGATSSPQKPAGQASAAPGRDVPGVSADCKIWSTRTDGPYKVENNQWGFEKSAGGFEQCLLTRQRDGRTEIGWTWNWPGVDKSVFAYPQIIYGWKPWSGGVPSDDRFPMRVGDVEHITMRYEVETQAEGSYNLAPEIWLTETSHWSEQANPKIITAEIMFWMDYQGSARPAGTIVDRPNLDGIEYELWQLDNIGDKGDGTGWTIYTFKSPVIQHQGVIEIHTLMQYMVTSGRVDPDNYIASVEFGNEVMGGSGTTWVKQFEVDVRP